MTLTSLGSVKTAIGVTGNAEDTLLNQLIVQADRLIKNYCRYALESASYTEYPQGYGNRFLDLRQQPVTAIASIYQDPNRLFPADTLLTAGTDYDLVQGRVVKLIGTWTQAVQWTKGLLSPEVVPSIMCLKITYTAGYAVVPDDLELAANMLVAILRRIRKGGAMLNSESLGGYSVSFAGVTANPLKGIEAMLSPYRRLRA